MHLLYVDDDRINLMLFENACAALPGLQLSTAASSAEALEQVRIQAPQLLVIDLHLPDGDGTRAAGHAAPRSRPERGAGLPVQRRRRRRCCASAPPTPASPAAGPSRSTAAACARDCRRWASPCPPRELPPRARPPAWRRSAHGRAAGEPGHARRAHAGGAAPLPGRVPQRPARRRDPQGAVVADPARHHPARAPGQVGAEVRHHLDARRLAAGGVDRQAGQAAARLPGRGRPRGAGAPRHALRPAEHRRRRWTRCAPKAPPACWCCRCTRSIRPPPPPASSTRWRPGARRRAGCRSCASCSSTTTTPATSPRWRRRCKRTGSAKGAAACW